MGRSWPIRMHLRKIHISPNQTILGSFCCTGMWFLGASPGDLQQHQPPAPSSWQSLLKDKIPTIIRNVQAHAQNLPCWWCWFVILMPESYCKSLHFWLVLIYGQLQVNENLRELHWLLSERVGIKCISWCINDCDPVVNPLQHNHKQSHCFPVYLPKKLSIFHYCLWFKPLLEGRRKLLIFFFLFTNYKICKLLECKLTSFYCV